jgi:hypothetical protein
MSKVTLNSHEHIAPFAALPQDKIKKCFYQSLALHRLKGTIFITFSIHS